jgi:hypothetical protein
MERKFSKLTIEMDALRLSTAPATNDRVYQSDTYAQPGALFLIPLERPWPFGIGEVSHTDTSGRVFFRWYGNNGNATHGQFERGWITMSRTVYYQDEPRRVTHTPYYDINVLINQDDILCHSFTLTKDKRLPRSLLNFASTHKDVWWTESDSECERAEQRN